MLLIQGQLAESLCSASASISLWVFKEHTHLYTLTHLGPTLQILLCQLQPWHSFLSRETIKRSLLRIPLGPLKNKHQLNILPRLLERSKVIKSHIFNLKMWLCFLKITTITFIQKNNNIFSQRTSTAKTTKSFLYFHVF